MLLQGTLREAWARLEVATRLQLGRPYNAGEHCRSSIRQGRQERSRTGEKPSEAIQFGEEFMPPVRREKELAGLKDQFV